MTTRKAVIVGTMCFVLADLWSPPLYSAIRVGWSMDAMACVPTQTTIQSNIAFQVAGKVKFREGQVGEITLICPLSDGPLIPETKHGENFVVKHLSLTYQDGDAETPGGLVSTSLRFLDKTDGNVADLERVSSNDKDAPNSGPSGWATYGKPNLSNPGGPIPGINHSLNFGKYFYYIQITLKRTSPNISVGVMGVTLHFG